MSVKRIMTYVATFCAGALAFAAVGVFQASFSSQATVEPDSGTNAAVESAAPAPEVPTDATLATPDQDPADASGNSGARAEAAMQTAEPTASNTSPAAASASQPQAGITEIGSLQRNTRVVVEGVVTRASEEDEFVIQDSTGSAQVYTGNTFFVANVGETVRVVGFVDESVFIEVYAQEVIHSDGRVTEISY